MNFKYIISVFSTILFLASNLAIAKDNIYKLPSMNDVIKKFDLTLYPGGKSGYYASTYKSIIQIEKKHLFLAGIDVNGEKYSLFSSIYYLLPAGNKLKFHATKATKQYHHYLGEPMNIIMIHPNGKLEKFVLGKDILRGQKPQLTIPANTYVAIDFNLYKAKKNKSNKTKLTNKYALIGCTTSPSWDAADCTRATQQELINKFPQHKTIIKKFT